MDARIVCYRCAKHRSRWDASDFAVNRLTATVTTKAVGSATRIGSTTIQGKESIK